MQSDCVEIIQWLLIVALVSSSLHNTGKSTSLQAPTVNRTEETEELLNILFMQLSNGPKIPMYK